MVPFLWPLWYVGHCRIGQLLLRGLSSREVNISDKARQHLLKTEDTKKCVDYCSSPHLSSERMGKEEQGAGQGERKCRMVWVGGEH